MAWNADSKSAARQVVQTTGCNCWFGRAALIMSLGWQRLTCWLDVMRYVSGQKNVDTERRTRTAMANMKTKEMGSL